MNDKIVNTSFNVWANNEDEGARLKQAVCDFIDWFGQKGIKVTASKLTNAIDNWQANALVKGRIINHFKA